MDIKVYPSALSGKVVMPSSKSVLHRVLIASALSESQTEIEYNGINNDVTATIDCLKSLGAKIEPYNGYFTVHPINKSDCTPTIDAKESASTLRFLLPVATALYGKAYFKGDKSLKSRPVKQLLNSLSGVEFSNDVLPFYSNGNPQNDEFIINGEISSQYVSGLLFALPLLNKKSKITVTGERVSNNYVKLTLNVLSLFGINIKEKGNQYIYDGNFKYKSPEKIKVEGDWSNFAPFAVANALGADIKAENLNEKSLQGDKDIFMLIEKINSGEIIDGKNHPDLIPFLALYPTFCGKMATFVNVERLKFKESDRINSTVKLVKSFGAKCEYLNGQLTVTGNTNGKEESVINTFSDHRICMAGIIGATLSKTPKIVKNAECLNKSYPNFISEVKSLGAKIDVL